MKKQIGKKIKKVFTLALLCFAVLPLSAEQNGNRKERNEQTLSKKEAQRFVVFPYAAISGGGAFYLPGAALNLDSSAGFHFGKWFSVGVFIGGNTLSNFGSVSLSTPIANTEAAYVYSSGAEFTLIPLYDKVIHPLFMVRIGGLTAGHALKVPDEEHLYSKVVQNRYFFASLSAGAELNVSGKTRLIVRGGWRFAGNTSTMGIKAGGLSGPEAAVSLRFVWKNILE